MNPRRTDSKDPFSFFADFWVWVTSEARAAAAVWSEQRAASVTACESASKWISNRFRSSCGKADVRSVDSRAGLPEVAFDSKNDLNFKV